VSVGSFASQGVTKGTSVSVATRFRVRQPSDQVGAGRTGPVELSCRPMPSRSTTAPASPKRAAVQAAVLRATEQLLAEGATYADLNIERIATRAGISRTAVLLLLRRQARAPDASSARTSPTSSSRRPTSGTRAPGTPRQRSVRRSPTSPASTNSTVRCCARSSRVSTYDEDVAVFWRQLLRALRRCVPLADHRRAGGGASRRAAIPRQPRSRCAGWPSACSTRSSCRTPRSRARISSSRSYAYGCARSMAARRALLVILAAALLVAPAAATPAATKTPACFGAASRDPVTPCHNPSLDYSAKPSPAWAPLDLNSTLPSADVHARPRACAGSRTARRARRRRSRWSATATRLVAVGSRRAGPSTALACPDAAPKQLPVQRGAAQQPAEGGAPAARSGFSATIRWFGRPPGDPHGDRHRLGVCRRSRLRAARTRTPWPSTATAPPPRGAAAERATRDRGARHAALVVRHVRLREPGDEGPSAAGRRLHAASQRGASADPGVEAAQQLGAPLVSGDRPVGLLLRC